MRLGVGAVASRVVAEYQRSDHTRYRSTPPRLERGETGVGAKVKSKVGAGFLPQS